jgi:uncharacterized spore protein YtfJ
VDLLDRLQEALTVRRAFGDPVERDGAVIVPVARVTGGGGGGESGGANGAEGGAGGRARPEGSGGGFGGSVSPIGVFVIKDGHVRWEPALDLNRIILGGQLLGGLALLIVRAWVRRRRA